jgi:hypothetical protein
LRDGWAGELQNKKNLKQKESAIQDLITTKYINK